jgi:hypothetical protein
MIHAPQRLSIYQLPTEEPKRGRYMAVLIRQDRREGMIHAELVAELACPVPAWRA